MIIQDIDKGKNFDWGKTSSDYAKYRDIYPQEFYDYILEQMGEMIKMTINFLFFENYETLDIFGPIEILARIDGVKTNYVSMQGGLVKSRPFVRTQSHFQQKSL